MNRTELVQAVAERTGLTKKDAEAAVKATFETISDELAKGGDFQLLGFGRFFVKERPERVAKSPATGESVIVPKKNVVKVKISSTLADRVNA